MLAGLIFCLAHAATATVKVEVHPNTSACTDLRHFGEGSVILGIVYLGVKSSLDACTAAAMGWTNGTTSQACMSACWFREVPRT
jgi:hypothetical protein